ncbi:MAG: aminotransferase class I/II-fold pyridoxal phosphate-dependent enzyme [Rhodobacteraceae bacterium]|jgi:arginine:pyruvate transaminase|nr:aminotransferase class I/II-fold pyridoxal phosphate-dependent enzyme [Paracoccaceae bacterium]
MRLGPRIAHIGKDGSDGWEIYYRTRDMIEAGERVLNLTIGEPDIKTDPAILKAMHDSALAGNTGYTFGAGKRALREAIAARVAARTGVPTTWQNVVITPGGQAALYAVHMVLLAEGDTGLYCDPYYATYPGTIRATGAEALAVPTRPEDAFAPTEAAIAAAARRADGGARTILINTPNNPAGTVYSRATLEGIGRAAAAHDLWIVSDEVYETQVWEGEHLSPRALPGLADRTVVIGSMSKGHAMTGSRLGWVVGPEAVVEAVTTLATNSTYGVVPFIQDGALFALSRGAAFEEAVAAPFRRRRDIALEALAGSNAVRLVPPQGAMYLMLDIRATGLSGLAFAEALLAEERIAVMPGESFGQASAGHVRIAMTIEDGAFAEAIRRLAAFAERRLPARA